MNLTRLSVSGRLLTSFTSTIRGQVFPTTQRYVTSNSDRLIKQEKEFSAKNYNPIPAVLEEGSGIELTDADGKDFVDFLSAYSAVNQGHQHPHIVAAMKDQIDRLALTSRAFHNTEFPAFAKKITDIFGYEKVMPMNTGAEAVETAIKIARKWAYDVKGVPVDEALIISCCGCFHGRTLAVISMSCDPDAVSGFGPLATGFLKVDFNDADGLEAILKEHGHKTAAFLVEPVQGEAGVLLPHEGYLQRCRELCTQYNTLMICDEIQSGLGRTGSMLTCTGQGVRPDMLTLGKALSGGMYPVSCVLADNEVMNVIKPGEHGSTYGGNPLAAAVAMASLDVLIEEKLPENAAKLEPIFREHLHRIMGDSPLLKEIRGMGLMFAVELHDSPKTAWDFCMMLKKHGVLAKPTHGTIVRFTPPLVMSEDDLSGAMKQIEAAWKEFMSMEVDASKTLPEVPICLRCGKPAK